MTLSISTLALIGLLMGGWTVAAAWAIWVGTGMQRRAEAAGRLASRLSRMVEESPALPMLVRTDGRIEGPDRIALWLGLDAMPDFLSELERPGAGIDSATLRELQALVTTAQKTGAPFRVHVRALGGARSLRVQGSLADSRVSPGGSALLWWHDETDTQDRIETLGEERDRARSAFAALAGLIEAAPMPMWHRAPDLSLMLVNRAYVAAVGAESAEAVIASGTELVEPVEGLSAMAHAGRAAESGRPAERQVSATIDGRRRALKVTDLPLGDLGVAGFALDIEEIEELRRDQRRFHEAQRELLDIVSSGVAGFDRDRQLVFANQPLQRLFGITPQMVQERIEFDRLLDRLRDQGRLPEARDFPEWRRERHEWFRSAEAREENWTLPDGTHLRVVAQPMPDGGLICMFEDQTEQVQLASARDTLLRTRTATFDNLFESVAVFATDGRLTLWNRRFAAEWGLQEDDLADHPRVDRLLSLLAPRLKRPPHVSRLRDVIRAATLDRKQTAGRVQLGDGRQLEFAGVPLPDGNALLTVLDITASQAIETALRERNEALMEAGEVKTRFLAKMSYELRTPLTSITGFAELLREGIAGPLSEPGAEYVDAILQSAGTLSRQIGDLLDLSQSEAGTLPLAMEPVAAFELVKQVVQGCGDLLAARSMTLDLRGDASVGKVVADPARLGQAIERLLRRAIADVPDGTAFRVTVERTPKGVRVEIADNGPGMDARTLARALDGLAESKGGTAQGSGASLDLPLARRLIEAHQGRLEVTSEPGRGTTATILLP